MFTELFQQTASCLVHTHKQIFERRQMTKMNNGATRADFLSNKQRFRQVFVQLTCSNASISALIKSASMRKYSGVSGCVTGRRQMERNCF